MSVDTVTESVPEAVLLVVVVVVVVELELYVTVKLEVLPVSVRAEGIEVPPLGSFMVIAS